MDQSDFGFDEFSVDSGDFEMQKVKKFDRFWKITTGGSIDQWPLVHLGKIYFGSLNHNLYCLDADTGSFVWKFKTSDRICISSPVVNNGIVYVGSYDQNMYAVDAMSGELVWKFKTQGEIASSAVVRNDIVYFGSRDRNYYAVDARTGALKWKFETQGEVISDGTFSGENIMFGSYDRNFYCLNAETGQMVWKFTSEQEMVNMQFATKDGYVYVASFDNLLRKIDVETGRELWKKKFSQYGLNCGTVIHGDTLLLPSRDGNIFALDFDGNTKWKFTTTKPVGTPVVQNEKVYFTSEDHNFYCLSLDEGKLVWKYTAQSMTWWKPALFHNKVYFGSYDCFLYALDSETGKPIWKFRTQGSPSTGPPPYDSFELNVDQVDDHVEEETTKTYEAGMNFDEEESDTYKTRTTYQMSSRYASKGKYRVDSSEESF